MVFVKEYLGWTLKIFYLFIYLHMGRFVFKEFLIRRNCNRAEKTWIICKVKDARGQKIHFLGM